MNEMIFKEIAIDTIMSQPTEPHYPSWYAELIRNLSPVEPNLDEWCTGCKEYDSEQHCCPRFNRVIRETLEEVKANVPDTNVGDLMLCPMCTDCPDNCPLDERSGL